MELMSLLLSKAMLMELQNACRHEWTISKLSDYRKQHDVSLEEKAHKHPNAEIIYCTKCQKQVKIIPFNTMWPFERAMRNLGEKNNDEELQTILVFVEDTLGKVLDENKWPGPWKQFGAPKFTITNPNFSQRIGGVELLKSFGFVEEEGGALVFRKNPEVTVEKLYKELQNEINTLKQVKRHWCLNNTASKQRAAFQLASILPRITAPGTFDTVISIREVLLQSDKDPKKIDATLAGLLAQIAEKEQEAEATNALFKKLHEEKQNRTEHQNGTKKLKTTDKMDVDTADFTGRREPSSPYKKLTATSPQKAPSPEPKRNMNIPAGLKNVANTCSFNSLLQTYFMLPKFLFEVLSMRFSNPPSTPEDSKLFNFLTSYQKLLAALTLTEKKAADPTELVRTLLTTTNTKLKFGAQEDVHEINCLLLQAMEDVTKLTGTSNIIKEYFYGDIVEEYRIPTPEGVKIEKRKDSVGHIMLDVSTHKDLYSSLDYYFSTTVTFNKVPNIPKITSFERLPEILIFQLNRAQFNTNYREAFKVNTKFKFQETISMDRYLLVHMQQSEEIKNNIKSLEADGKQIHRRLSEYAHWNGSNISLTTILRGSLEFTNTEPQTENKDVAVNYLQGSLDKVKQEIRLLKLQLEEIESQIDDARKMIREDKIYRLHSVLVHDGYAGLGHYWSFIKNHVTGKWYKFNDSLVTEVDKSTVFQEAEGGYMNMSAYCLFYVSDDFLTMSMSVTEGTVRSAIPEVMKETILESEPEQKSDLMSLLSSN